MLAVLLFLSCWTLLNSLVIWALLTAGRDAEADRESIKDLLFILIHENSLRTGPEEGDIQ